MRILIVGGGMAGLAAALALALALAIALARSRWVLADGRGTARAVLSYSRNTRSALV